MECKKFLPVTFFNGNLSLPVKLLWQKSMPHFFCKELMPCLLISSVRSPTDNPLMLWGPSKHVCLSVAEPGGEHEVHFPCAAENVWATPSRQPPIANEHQLYCQQSAGWQHLEVLWQQWQVHELRGHHGMECTRWSHFEGKGKHNSCVSFPRRVLTT